ncbi:MAG TPA: SIS domain-containing protein [Phycisphaerales bacterium]|nr:SIS domain-containing protein [Phycisphaerales bacterium]
MFDATSSLRAAHIALEELLASPAQVALVNSFVADIAATFARGNKVLIVGNGGSMCDAAHFAEELTGRFRNDRRPLPALACNDAGHLTCVANDYGFEHIFSRWVEALGTAGDTLIILSTSGNSPNCVRAAKAAHTRGMKSWALLGKTGGELKTAADACIIAPGATADRIQELHMLILHIVVEGVEVQLGLA